MSEILDNSVWPNGLKKDDEGYTTYYRMGTNKLDISTITWPTGDKLVSPYVYQNGRLVGFCDTKALTVSGNTTVNLPYTHIEANFAAISEGTLTVNAPNATVKKFKWSVVSGGDSDSGNTGDTIVLGTKYMNCTSVNEVKTTDSNYKTVDIIDGVWTESLKKLIKGTSLFYNCTNLAVFNSDLSSLTDGNSMFESCTALTDFNCNLPVLSSAHEMFRNCDSLVTFNTPLPSLVDGRNCFFLCDNLTSFNSAVPVLKNGNLMFSGCTNLVSFTSDLPSLTNGSGMFSECNLDVASIQNIARTINDVNDLVDENSSTGIMKQIDLGNISFFDDDIRIAAEQLKAKGWNVESNYIEYIPNLGEGYKYDNCKTVDHVAIVDPNYLTTDITNGTWNERLDDLIDSSSMFRNNSDIITFNANLYSLTNGGRMFDTCKTITTFTSDLSSLTSGSSMFKGCSNLATFNCASLSSLTNGDSMFYGCSKLTAYNYGNLPYLTSAKSMFKSCTNLATFNCTNLSSLKNAENMFYGCTKINNFNSDLSSLTHGYWTFYGCSKLVTFNSSLPSLTNGQCMFMNCKLDTTSVQKIADTIKDVTKLENGTNASNDVYKNIHIGITNSTPNSDEITSFNTIATKGWTVYVNGSAYTPTSASSVMTLDELGNEVETPLPFYAKPVPTIEDIAEYIDENGDFYSIMGGQFIYGDDLSTYGMFTCEEDAAANMRLTKIERTR